MSFPVGNFSHSWWQLSSPVTKSITKCWWDTLMPDRISSWWDESNVSVTGSIQESIFLLGSSDRTDRTGLPSMFVHIFTVMHLLHLHWPTEEVIEIPAWSSHTYTVSHTQSAVLLSHLMFMSWIDPYETNRSVHAFATRATPRVLILAQTGDRCYWSTCSCLVGMTASEDEIYLFTSGPCAVEAFSTVWAIGRPHINCELSDRHDTQWILTELCTLRSSSGNYTWCSTGEVLILCG